MDCRKLDKRQLRHARNSMQLAARSIHRPEPGRIDRDMESYQLSLDCLPLANRSHVLEILEVTILFGGA